MLNFNLLAYVEFGLLKRYLILGRHTEDRQMISKCRWESNPLKLGWRVGARARLTDKGPFTFKNVDSVFW